MEDELSARAAAAESLLQDVRAELGADPRAAPHLEALTARLSRAIALLRFKAREDEGPFHRADFRGPPSLPAGPLFPRLAALGPLLGPSGTTVQRLLAALEALQQQLVFEADCQEYVDAHHNSAQFLRAAGHLDLAEAHALALAELVRAA